MLALRRIALLGAVLGACGAISGCTIMSFAFARSLGDQNQSLESLRGSELRDLPVGTRLRGRLFDGRSFAGRFVSIVPDEESVYATRYAEWRAGQGLPLPRLGEAIVLRGILDVEGYFDGFDFDGVRIRGREKAIGLREISAIQVVDSTQRVEGDALRSAAAEGRLPFRSRLQLERDGGRGMVRSEDVATISVRRGKLWTWTPVLVGLAVDVAVIEAYRRSSR